VQVPAGLTAERDLEVQPSVPLLPTPWLARHESGGIVYFLYTTAARVERFDLASGSWLADIALPETPTAFWADADGLYVSFGRRTSRFALDGTGEAHLRNTGVDATGLFTVGDFLYIYAPDDLLSANKWTGALIDQEEYWYTMQGLSVAPTVGKAFARSVGVSPSDIVEVVLAPDGTLGQQDDSPYHGTTPERRGPGSFRTGPGSPTTPGSSTARPTSPMPAAWRALSTIWPSPGICPSSCATEPSTPTRSPVSARGSTRRRSRRSAWPCTEARCSPSTRVLSASRRKRSRLPCSASRSPARR
jgi:uncharacterized protein YcfL